MADISPLQNPAPLPLEPLIPAGLEFTGFAAALLSLGCQTSLTTFIMPGIECNSNPYINTAAHTVLLMLSCYIRLLHCDSII